MSSAPTRAFVVWPSAPLTDGLVRKALGALQPCPEILDSVPESFAKLILWSAYDSIDHELTHDHPSTVLSCAYTIRKSLIRKHFLARTIQNYLVKHPDSILKTSVPRTWDLEISFADELDEKWSDELYDLADELEHGDKWWILKPGMADRGMGIRLFNSKDALEQIFVEFEGDSDEEDEEKAGDTAVVTSQLRHFVIQVQLIANQLLVAAYSHAQEYLSTPLLLDPRQVPLDTSMPPVDVADVRGYKVSFSPGLR
jgi:tubulin--tyrosine ligase